MAGSAAPAPDRISPDRIVDFDVYNPDPDGTGYDKVWIALRDRSKPLMWTTSNGGHWIVTRGALTKTVLLDHDHFSSHVLMVPRERGLSNFLPTAADPPHHLPFRALVNKGFAPSAIRALEPYVREYTGRLIDEIMPRGGCEFMADFAKSLPIAVFFRLADLPLEDHEKLDTWMEPLMRPDESLGEAEAQAVYARSMEQFSEYLQPIIAKRRVVPGSDLISAIVTGDIRGRPISDAEAINMCTALIVGGIDTVLALMSFTMNYLASDPHLRHLLRDQPERISDAVEEFCRRFPIGVNTREVKSDIELDGVLLKAGDLIATPQILHALDDTEYPDPEKVDIDRATGGNSAFGHGIHRCPGSFLGKTELRILLEEWLPRIPDFEVAPNSKVVISAGVTSGIYYLPLRWDVPAQAAA